jgi:predicted outer membrane repeat protein
MKVRKGFVALGIFFAVAAFSLVFASCVLPEEEKTATVETNADDGPGSLREAIEKAPYEGTIIIDPSVKTIELTSRLNIKRDITIEGNGVTLTRAAEWDTESNDSQLIYLENHNMVTIRRVLFKDGRASGYGGAIYNRAGDLTLESCIFSGNRAKYSGSAIYSAPNSMGYWGNLIIKGCTFYGNSVETGGGTILLDKVKLTLEGTLFYNNIADYPIVSLNGSGTVASYGYNVVDVEYGHGIGRAGWNRDENDKYVTDLLLSPASFKLFPDSGAAGLIDTLPEGYPANDFYGNPITAPASAGAVQDEVIGNGFILETTVNNGVRGRVSVTPPDDDGLYSGLVTVTATPAEGYGLYWLVDGINVGEVNPLVLTVTDHTKVQAVFAVLIVNKFTDETGSAEIPGTLRYALTNVQNGDIVRLSNVTPGQTLIKLTGRLPDIYRNISIEGNGVTLTRDAAWTTYNENSQLMCIPNGTVTISGIHFKDGRAKDGGAIRKNNGELTLESCIFSGNQASNQSEVTSSGGAVYNSSGNLTVKGCTFYKNSSTRGGAIYVSSGTLTLTGNLFYGNTVSADWGLIVNTSFGTKVPSYNVVEAYGTGDNQAGWNAGTGDKTFAELGISVDPINTGTFKPASGLDSVIPNPPPEGFPATDFYGETRTFPGAPGAVK